MKKEPEWVKMKRLGFRIPNEDDATISGTIEKTNPASIDEDSAKIAQIIEPPGVWDEAKHEDVYCDPSKTKKPARVSRFFSWGSVKCF